MKGLFLSLFALCYFTAKSQDTARADAKLTAATVYYGYGAELTHEAKVTGGANVKQIVIKQLSTAIDENSLQINVPENVALLSYRFNVFYPQVGPVKNLLVTKLQDSLDAVNKELRLNTNFILIEEQTLDKTGKLIETVISTSGNKTVTSDEALKLINAYTAKIEKAKTNIFNLREAAALLSKKANAFEDKIDKASESPETPAKPYGQLVLQVICKSNGEIPVSLSYFTRNAGWTPSYDVRVKSKTNEIKLVYKAAVTQTTGIDWKQTKLTLSTANPSFGGTAPLLNAWYLKLYVPAIYSQLQYDDKAAVQNTIPSTDRSLAEVVVVGNANNYYKKELGYATAKVDPSTIAQYTTLSESQLNTNFEIDLPYDINSDGQLHAVTIKEEKINATLKNYAVPKLDRDGYLLAEISDWQNLNLLPGSANIIMDNTYLGKSVIDPNSTADTLNLSLGKDKRVAIKRTLVKDFTSTKTNGNTTTQTFTYEITVKNNKLTNVDLILKDQYPISKVKEIEVKLADDGAAKVNEELGVLTWQLQLKPGESKKVRFSYTVKYPKDKTVENL